MDNKNNIFESELKSFLMELKIEPDSPCWQAASCFIGSKGLYIHKAIYELLKNKLQNTREILYCEIATTFRYDKKIRNLLYRFIAMVEEKLISIISNFFDDDIDNIKLPKLNTRQDIKEIISQLKKDLQTKSIWKIFEHLDFYWIIELFYFNANSRMWNSELFSSNCMKEIKNSLHKIRKLRNIVNHNRMLLLELSTSEIIDHLNAFISILSEKEWDSFKQKINKCALKEDADIPKENWHQKQVEWELPECIKIALDTY